MSQLSNFLATYRLCGLYSGPMSMRILVCGGRDYTDETYVFRQLDRLHAKKGVSVLIHGNARGADTLAKKWATSRGIPHLPFPADWDAHGKAAGPIRNREMLRDGKPDGVVAFPGGQGTADMVAVATKAGLVVWDLRRGRDPKAAM